jgi:hypothetical protein
LRIGELCEEVQMIVCWWLYHGYENWMAEDTLIVVALELNYEWVTMGHSSNELG